MKQKAFWAFLLVSIVSLAVVVAGYIWDSQPVTRDFNFAPGFMIDFGTITLIVGIIGAVVQWRKSKNIK